jgi:hypothetical protein
MARRRIFEESSRRRLSAEGPIVAQIDPEAAGPGLRLRQHRNRSVVSVDPFGGEHVTTQRVENGRERDDAGADPIGERRRVDLDAFALKVAL